MLDSFVETRNHAPKGTKYKRTKEERNQHLGKRKQKRVICKRRNERNNHRFHIMRTPKIIKSVNRIAEDSPTSPNCLILNLLLRVYGLVTAT